MQIQLDNSIFLEEAHEILFQIEKLINTTEEIDLQELFRHIHTLKGNSSIFKFTNIEEVTHIFEDLLDVYRQNNLQVPQNTKGLFLDVKDLLDSLTTLYTSNQAIDENTILATNFIKDQLKKEILKAHYLLRKQQFKSVNNNVVEEKEEKQVPKQSNIQTQKSKTILIVDDSSMIRNVASMNAEALGYNVLLAGDGLEALEIIKETQSDIDLIFSDINMPQMDGLTFVSHLRQNNKYEFTPIVMMTTEKAQHLKEKGKSLGVKAWLVKPFHKEKFALVIEKILS